MVDLEMLRDFALITAWNAGQLIMRHYQTGVAVDWKADESPVTIADRSAETYIRGEIERRFPGHAILGEEFGEQATGADFRWLIDPIDGTKSFVRGVPLFGTLIGLEIEGQIQVGVAHFPALVETVSAARGCGCLWNGKPARVSQTTLLSQALVAHADAATFARLGRAAAWDFLQSTTYYRAGWCDAYGYLLVATGRADIMVDPIMNAWDCGPFPVILGEAGGYFGDWRGQVSAYGGEALATNLALLPQVLAGLNAR